jgi:hypothetical protein
MLQEQEQVIARWCSLARCLWRKFDALFVLSLLALSLGTNVYLALRHRYVYAGEASERVGTRLPAFAVAALDGRSALIDWASDSRPTVLYVFKPSCVWCARNLSNIKALSEQRGRDYRFIGLSLSDEGLRKYVEDNGMGFPVYTRSHEPSGARNVVWRATPETIVVGRDGLVRDDWVGAYTERSQVEIESRFGVRLPGLLAAAAVGE